MTDSEFKSLPIQVQEYILKEKKEKAESRAQSLAAIAGLI
jgi:hypothetical protein